MSENSDKDNGKMIREVTVSVTRACKLTTCRSVDLRIRRFLLFFCLYFVKLFKNMIGRTKEKHKHKISKIKNRF